jgi:hypothetical protein
MTTEGDHGDAGRRLVDRGPQDGVERIRRRLVTVVENDRALGGQQREELPEELAAERRDVRTVFGQQVRQRVGSGIDPAGERDEVRDGRCRIPVTLVHVIPEGRPLAATEVVCDERRLAAARGAAHPDAGQVCEIVESPDQPLPRGYRRQARQGQLCQLRDASGKASVQGGGS